MPLGQPAVNTPKSLDLRSLQQTIDSVRERLEFAEKEVTRQGGILSQVGSLQAIQTLQAQVAQLQVQLSAVQNLISGIQGLGSIRSFAARH